MGLAQNLASEAPDEPGEPPWLIPLSSMTLRTAIISVPRSRCSYAILLKHPAWR